MTVFPEQNSTKFNSNGTHCTHNAIASSSSSSLRSSFFHIPLCSYRLLAPVESYGRWRLIRPSYLRVYVRFVVVVTADGPLFLVVVNIEMERSKHDRTWIEFGVSWCCCLGLRHSHQKTIRLSSKFVQCSYRTFFSSYIFFWSMVSFRLFADCRIFYNLYVFEWSTWVWTTDYRQTWFKSHFGVLFCILFFLCAFSLVNGHQSPFDRFMTLKPELALSLAVVVVIFVVRDEV